MNCILTFFYAFYAFYTFIAEGQITIYKSSIVIEPPFSIKNIILTLHVLYLSFFLSVSLSLSLSHSLIKTMTRLCMLFIWKEREK